MMFTNDRIVVSYPVPHRSAMSTRHSQHGNGLGEATDALEPPGVGHGCVRREELDELGQAAVELVAGLANADFGVIEEALVAQDDLEPRHEERRLARTRHEVVVLERRVLREDLPIGPVAHAGSGDAPLRLPDDAQLAAVLERREGRIGARAAAVVVEDTGLAAMEAHRVRLATTVDLDVEAFAQRVHHGGADAVQAARCGVRTAAELSARVQLGIDDLDTRQPRAGLDIDGHAATPVLHLHAAVGAQDHVDAVTVAGNGLVDRVVYDLPEAVHEARRSVRADVHAGPLAHGLETFEDLKMVGGVLGCHKVRSYLRKATIAGEHPETAPSVRRRRNREPFGMDRRCFVVVWNMTRHLGRTKKETEQ
jgi:hypothetical protein